MVQDVHSTNLFAARGVAIREFALKPGHGTADYLLYVDQKAAGVVEAKPAGHALTGVETQSGKYSDGANGGGKLVLVGVTSVGLWRRKTVPSTVRLFSSLLRMKWMYQSEL